MPPVVGGVGTMDDQAISNGGATPLLIGRAVELELTAPWLRTATRGRARALRQFLLYIQIQSRSMPLPAPDVKDCVLGSWSAAHQLLP